MNGILYKKIHLFLFSFVFIFLLSTISIAEYKTTHKEILLIGELKVGKFFDANDQPEKAFILTLQNPINIEKDEFGGPVKDIKEVQLVFIGNINGKKYLNRNVQVKGTLFYPITAHHHTKVLMEVKDIQVKEK